MKIEHNSSVGELIRKMETDYVNGTTQISKYVNFSMHDNLEKIEAYLNSKHTTGEFDSLGREKPFFNIVTAATNVWYRATNIKSGQIKIKATKDSDITNAFLATVLTQDWMRRENFAYFLNEWGRVLARYGSAVVKFVEKGDKLIPLVIPWSKLIVDTVEFEPNPKVEVIELTESELRKRGYDKEMVNELCNAIKARETLDKRRKDNKNDYIRLYEIHGEMPLSYLTGKPEDSDEFVQQMHVISFVGIKGKKKEFQDFTLYAGREEKDPYMITHLIKEDSRTLAIGAVEHLFESQWMMNHTAKSIKDQLDLASKLIFQTADPNFLNQNAHTAIETGDILIHAVNQPLTQVNNSSHDISSLQAYGSQWKALANEITGVSESMMGKNPPSGTAWRLTEALLNESRSLFEMMTRNKGISLDRMFRIHIIPFLKKRKLNNKEQITAVLDAYDIGKIDKKFIKNQSVKKTNDAMDERILRGEMPTEEEQMQMMQQMQMGIQQQLGELGNERFFKPSEISSKTWKDTLKDIEWDLEIDVTGEQATANDDLTTLSTVFQTIADPVKRQVLATDEGKKLFNLILNKTATVSPLLMSDMPNLQMGAPAGGGASGSSEELSLTQ